MNVISWDDEDEVKSDVSDVFWVSNMFGYFILFMEINISACKALLVLAGEMTTLNCNGQAPIISRDGGTLCSVAIALYFSL